MKIVHCCLANFYIDNYNYQENVLPRVNRIDGHDVTIIASTETYINNQKIGYVEPKNYVNSDGISVKRIPYRRIPFHFVRRKIRSYPGVYQLLKEENPDLIFFHGVSAWELRTVVKYKLDHPDVKLYADNHATLENSAKGLFSRYILHGMFYKSVIKNTYKHIDKIFYVSLEAGQFLNTIYDIPHNKMEFYPLGGMVVNSKYREKVRRNVRHVLGVSDNDVLLVHSGKLDELKRTEDVLLALQGVSSDNLKLIIMGSIPEKMRSVLEPLIESDERVRYLGWKTPDELRKYLCAADVYVQPGSQSATMQNAICCGCAIILYPHKSHKPYLQGNGYYVRSIMDMRQVFSEIAERPKALKNMSAISTKVAYRLLDYKKIAARIYE